MALARWAIQISVVVLGLLAMAQQSMPLSLRNPMNEIKQKPIGMQTSPVGVVSLTSASECLLNKSGVFTVTSTQNIAGKIFRIGKINGTEVVYARAGELMVNVGTTVQILVDIFNVRGIVHFGGAASVNESVVIGDVSVPDQVAYTAAWSWRNSSTDEVQPFLKDMVYGNLSFGDFNVPQKGDNLLGRIFYWASTWFTGQQTQNSGFWLPVNPDWLRIASQIQGLKLETHVNETVYVPYKPVVQFGLKAGTADLFIVNEAYGDFLHKTFNISTIDTSDSAIALTCFSNNIPYVVFRGVSNKVRDNDPKPEYAPLGNINAIKATAAFLGLLNPDDSVTNE